MIRNSWNLSIRYQGKTYNYWRLKRGEDFVEAETGIQFTTMPPNTDWKCHGKSTPVKLYGISHNDGGGHLAMIGFTSSGGDKRNGICAAVRNRLENDFGIELTKIVRMSGFAAPLEVSSNWKTKSAMELEFMTELVRRENVHVCLEPVVFSVSRFPGEEMKRLLGGEENEYLSRPILMPISQAWFPVSYRDLVQSKRDEPGFDINKDLKGHKDDTTSRGVAWVARFSKKFKKFCAGSPRLSNEEKKALFGWKIEESNAIFEMYKNLRKRSWEIWQMDPNRG